MLVDTHCHLDFNAFDADREQVIARARDAGVEKIMDPGINLETSAAALRLAERYPEVFAAVGIHPNDALSMTQSAMDELRQMAQHPRVKAVGEIGLDYYRQHAPHDLQRRIFQEQLELAGELGLPVIIHNREADDDLLAALVQWQRALVESGSPLAAHPGVLHSFSSNHNFAARALDLGFMISFAGPITFNNAPALQQTAASLPPDKVLVETDAPFLAPHPHRGDRNEPAYVRLTAEKLAELQNVTSESAIQRVSSNALRLFNW